MENHILQAKIQKKQNEDKRMNICKKDNMKRNRKKKKKNSKKKKKKKRRIDKQKRKMKQKYMTQKLLQGMYKRIILKSKLFEIGVQDLKQGEEYIIM
jgi:hypothetical protein